MILTSHEEPKDIKLTDFGLAVDLNKDGASIQKQMAGTPAYISPEIFLNMSYTKKGDIWACGILLYVLLLGFIPYPSNDTKEIKYLISAGKFDFFENEEWSDVTQQAIDLVSSLLSYEPTDRITARQALRHPWISKRETVPSKLHRTNTIDELKEYNKQVRKWKSLGQAIILTARFKKLIVHDNDHSSIPEVIDEDPAAIPTLEKGVTPKGTVVSFTDGDLKHYESQFIIDVIAITQSITEAMHYNNTELYNQLSAPDCTNATVTESLRHKGERVMILDPVVHMIGMKGACVTYKKRILFVGANSKFESVSYSETRVWKNFDGKWRCVHYHSS